MTDNHEGTEVTKGAVSRSVTVGLLALVAVMGVAIWGAVRFVDDARQRELQAWQTRLGIVADSRANAVEQWIDTQFDTMWALAENVSLQLYMTQVVLGRTASAEQTASEPEAAYLTNLLLVAAERGGFAITRSAPRVNANLEPSGQAGIALTDAAGNILVATPDMPPLSPRIRTALSAAAMGQPALVDMHIGAGGVATMGFVVPVYAVQQNAGASRNIGFVVGLRPVADDLFPRLRQPGDTGKTAETYVVRRTGPAVEYLSPLADGTPVLKRRLAVDTPDLAAAFVASGPGGFGIKRDYKGGLVLVTGRALASAPWFLVRTIGRDEALAPSDQRLQTILAVLILIVVAAATTIIAVWRHGTSMRAAELAAKYRRVADRLKTYGEFMRTVTDRQPTAIAVVDQDDRFTFANREAAEGTGISQEDMIGKAMASVVGPVKANALHAMNDLVLRTREPASQTHTFDEGGDTRIVRSDHTLLPRNSSDSEEVLITLQDITDLVVEREKRERGLHDLVATLVTLVDRRDPHAAYQSRRVAEVACAIASEMKMPEDVVRAVRLAGTLMNVGKVLAPIETLTKVGGLTEDERLVIRDSIMATADLLNSVAFDVPVTETLQMLQEHWDGSGYPQGLSADEISPAARIVAVANAFVGMVSPRAYRDALPVAEACAILISESGTKFDRRPVSALINYLDNREGRMKWSHFSEPPDLGTSPEA